MPVVPLPRTARTLGREIGTFGTVGLVSFLVDIGVFQVMYASAGLDAVASKLVATLVSMTLAYVGHRYWSFAHRARTGLRREYLIFTLVNGVTLLLSLAAVWFVRYPLGQHEAWVLQLTNVGSIAVGTAIRYLSYRRWVFVDPDHPAADDARFRAPAAIDPGV